MHVITVDIAEQCFDIFDTSADASLSLSHAFNNLRRFGEQCGFGMRGALLNGGNHMFRISTIDTQSERRLVVEGTLVPPWVEELQRSWTNAGDALEGRSLVIDLTNATVISREGENAIFHLMREGAKFSCGGVLTRHVLKGLARRCHTTLKDVLMRNCSEK